MSQCTSQKIVGHRYEVKGQYYDDNPSVPLIPQTVGTYSTLGPFFNNYNDFYNDYHYQCFDLKNEGTQASTIAQSAAAGTASREQLLNYYSFTLDAIRREKNCQSSILSFQNYRFGLFEKSPSNQLYNELNENMRISRSDEKIESTSYNIIATNFNNAIISCSNSNQVVGTDGMCHDICVAPNIYCK